MRILAVAPYYEPEGGGLERYAHNTLLRLAGRGHDVRAVAFSRQGSELTVRDGVALERVQPMTVIGNTPVHPELRRRLQRTIREFRPDVIVGHTPVPFAAEMASQAARRAAVPFVTTYHGGRLRGSSRLLGGLAALDRVTAERRMLENSARLIAVSPYVRDHALARHKEKVTVIPPGVDANRFTPGDAPRRHDVLFVGPLDRHYRWKGLDVLWNAFRQVKSFALDARLVLVGTGDRLGEFAARAHNFSGALVLPGRVTEGQLIEWYRRAAVTVLPSITEAESFGMVMAEANACGCPVVGSRIGGIPDFVRDGDNGVLAKAGDASALAAAISGVLEDPVAAAAMGRRGRERVLREHDWDDLAVRTEKVLEAAVARPQGPAATPLQPIAA